MATKRVSKDLKQGRRDASRRGRVTKDSPEMKLLRKKSDSKKTGIRKTRKQRDILNKRTVARKAVKSPRRIKRSASAKTPKETSQKYLPGDPRGGASV
jgi:hypothetical protein